MRSLLYIVIGLILLVTSCTSTKLVEVPVETIRTEYIHDVRFDSIYVKDSIDKCINGDTVFIYKEKLKYVYKNKTDTVLKTDTVTNVVKMEVIRNVEVNHMKWYQKTLMWIGGISSLFLLLFIIYKSKR